MPPRSRTVVSAVAQCESLRYKLLNGLAVRRACYGVLRFIMESGAKGCEVVVSGKLRAARAKSMKFTVRAMQYNKVQRSKKELR
jgi:small subunit ribosomal protein S3e